MVITSRFMPRKTRQGRIAWEQIRGLEEYIRRAEIDDLKQQEKQGVFEKLLPYAIAFNLADRWGHAFEGLYTQPPDWYQSSTPNFSTWYLVEFPEPFGQLDEHDSPLPAALRRRRRAAAGPRAVFGGGGSSGGGFGGGGGGSW